ncbi:MAG TPA: vanadium-dependent haloperoxidase [Vicinamibacteria bacterium]
MKAHLRAVLVLLPGLTALPAAADVVTDWNEIAVSAGYAASLLPPFQSRNAAIVHLAVYDAVNSARPTYTPYRRLWPAPPGTSPEAAAAAAAHAVLAHLYPDQAAKLDAALAASLAEVADEKARAQGQALGQQVAAALLAERQGDGADAPNTYRPVTTPGAYAPTTLPIVPTWGAVRPFGLDSGRQFRPAPPYRLDSAEWAKDFREVKRLGAKVRSERTPEQTEAARFWEYTGAGTYNPMVRQVAAAKHLDLAANARLFALTSMAAADAIIAVFDAKYTYNFWRPVTAIRNADGDGNDATDVDPAWEPFIATPLHPEYPCAHCINQSAVARVLELEFGDEAAPFTLKSPTAPGVEHRFTRLSAYVQEVIEARVCDGVHYRTSGQVGAAMGRQIGDHLVGKYFKRAAPSR